MGRSVEIFPDVIYTLELAQEIYVAHEKLSVDPGTRVRTTSGTFIPIVKPGINTDGSNEPTWNQYYKEYHQDY